jgi:hypothetical protein
MFDNRAADIKKHKIITTRGESEKKKKQMFHVLVFPLKKSKMKKV